MTGKSLTGKSLKAWAADIPDAAIIEVKRYDWEEVVPDKIRAIFTCPPSLDADLTMEESDHV